MTAAEKEKSFQALKGPRFVEALHKVLRGVISTNLDWQSLDKTLTDAEDRLILDTIVRERPAAFQEAFAMKERILARIVAGRKK